jgi:membrane protein
MTQSSDGAKGPGSKATPYVLIRETISGWLADDAFLHAAALAFYTIFSLAPLLIITLSIATQAVPSDEVEWRIVTGVEKQAGEEAAALVKDIIVNYQSSMSRNVAAGLGILVLLFGASTVFIQLRESLNAMWGLVPRTTTVRQSLVQTVVQRVVGAILALGVGYVLVAAMVINAVWAAVSTDLLGGFLAYFQILVPFLRVWTVPLVYTAIFTLLFKFMPQAHIRWRDVWLGALLTAVFFWAGGYFIGLYVARSIVTSFYGAASSLVVLLMWVYYSVLIILLGARFTYVYAQRRGRPIVPDANMMRRIPLPQPESAR